MRTGMSAAGPRTDTSRTSPTPSGAVGATKRDRIAARASAPVMVCTGGKPASSAPISSAICGSKIMPRLSLAPVFARSPLALVVGYSRVLQCGRFAGRDGTQRGAAVQRTHLLQCRCHSLLAVFNVAPDTHRGHPHRRGEALVEHHPAHRSAYRHSGNRFPGATDRRCHTTESRQGLLAFESHTVSANLGQFGGELCLGVDGVLGLSR